MSQASDEARRLALSSVEAKISALRCRLAALPDGAPTPSTAKRSRARLAAQLRHLENQKLKLTQNALFPLNQR